MVVYILVLWMYHINKRETIFIDDIQWQFIWFTRHYFFKQANQSIAVVWTRGPVRIHPQYVYNIFLYTFSGAKNQRLWKMSCPFDVLQIVIILLNIGFFLKCLSINANFLAINFSFVGWTFYPVLVFSRSW